MTLYKSTHGYQNDNSVFAKQIWITQERKFKPILSREPRMVSKDGYTTYTHE